MDPLTIGLLTSLGSGAMQGIGTAFQNSNRAANLARIMQMLSPGSMIPDVNRLFDAFRQSPMYSAMRSRAAFGAQSLGNTINANANRVGLGGSGLAAVSAPLAHSSFLQSFNNIDAQGWQDALNSVLGSRRLMAGAALNYPMQSAWGSGIGGGLDTFGPLLKNYLANKYPQAFGAPKPIA